MDANALPANFASTANALEGLAFSAKDALLVVDDFVPVGGIGDRALQGVAERLFRSTGNRQGRSRMSGSGRLCEAQAPRALVLATGEEVPRGGSLLVITGRPKKSKSNGQFMKTAGGRAGHRAIPVAQIGGSIPASGGRRRTTAPD